jgi:5-methylcytosine-specific restriction enzyme subunit McrC
MPRRIPIQNLYYLLCYAWEVLPLRSATRVVAGAAPSVIDLLARVLLEETEKLLLRGLPPDYVPNRQVYAGLKGKPDWSATIRRHTLPRQRTVCQFDELTLDTLPNRVLKVTLERLTHLSDLSEAHRRQAARQVRQLDGVPAEPLDSSTFWAVRRHRQAGAYRAVLSSCELLFHHLLPGETEGTYRFHTFEEDDARMGYLFESFVRNFYRRELPTYHLKREYIDWQLRASAEDRRYLPRMETDLSLENGARKLIIDTKFYAETLRARYDARKLHAPHLYQLFAYLKNVATDKPCEGLLLYPVVDDALSLTYHDDRHRIRVHTLNLAQDWPLIHAELLALVERT